MEGCRNWADSRKPEIMIKLGVLQGFKRGLLYAQSTQPQNASGKSTSTSLFQWQTKKISQTLRNVQILHRCICVCTLTSISDQQLLLELRF